MKAWARRHTAPLTAAAAVVAAMLWMSSPFGARGPAQTQRHLERVFAYPLPSPDTLLSEVTFAVFDVETTGLSPARDRIVELGLARLRAGYVLGSRTWLVNPEQPIPEVATNVHGIRDEDVRDQPTFASVYPAFGRQLIGTVMVAHNAGFDVRFLQAETARAGLPAPPNRVVDTLRLTRKRYPDLPAHTLDDLVRYFQAGEGDRHRAGGDALLLARILVRITDELGPEATLGELYEVAGGWMLFDPPL